MLKNHGALSASLAVSLLSLAVACSSSSDSPAAGNSGDAGADSGGATATAGNAGSVDVPGAAGAPDVSTDGGAAGEPSMSSGGTSGVAGSAAGSAGSTAATGPCTFAVTGGKTFPEAGSVFACTATSRVYQQKGMGSFNALVGASAHTNAQGGDISTLACSIDSTTAPKAGDVWTMNAADHPGNCGFTLIHAGAATLWNNSSNSAPSGTAVITFVSATLTHGVNKPEDVYYVYEMNIAMTFTNQQGGAPDVNGTAHLTGGVPFGG